MLPFVLDFVPGPVKASVKGVVRDKVVHGQNRRVISPFVLDEHPAVHAEFAHGLVDAVSGTCRAPGRVGGADGEHFYRPVTHTLCELTPTPFIFL